MSATYAHARTDSTRRGKKRIMLNTRFKVVGVILAATLQLSNTGVVSAEPLAEDAETPESSYLV